MKINWNKKYTTYAIYAALVLAAVIFCIFCGVYIRNIWDGFVFILDVIAPLIYGCVIAYMMFPLTRLFEKLFSKIRRGVVRRGLSVALTYIVVLTVFSLLLYAVVPQIGRSLSDLQANLVTYSDSIQKWLDEMEQSSGIMATIVGYLEKFINFDALSQPINFIIESTQKLISEFSPYIMGIVGSVAVQVKNIIIGFVFAGYLLCSKELVMAQVNKLAHVFMSETRIEKIKGGIRQADKTFGQYLIGMILDAIIVGVLTAIAMLIARIPYVPLISVLVACTNIIPIFGPFIGAIPSVLFIFIADPLKALIFIVIILVIQQIDGNFIAPRILGGSTGLQPIIVITAITVMGGIFGMVGMIIGVPVFAILGKFISDKTRARAEAKNKKSGVNDIDADGNITTEADEPVQNGADEKGAQETVPETEAADISGKENISETTRTKLIDRKPHTRGKKDDGGNDR